MQRRAHQLHRRRRQELRRARPADVPLQPRHCVERQPRRQQRRHVERGEDGQAVAQREQGVRRPRHGPRPRRGAEELREAAVLVEAEGQVCARRCEELGRARGAAAGGRVARRGGRGVERVGGQVGAGVEGEDQGEGLREEEVVRVQEEGAEGGSHAGA